MKTCKVTVNKRIESAKFGVVIPQWTSGLKAWTEDYDRFYVEHPQDPAIRLVVDGKDIDVERYGG